MALKITRFLGIAPRQAEELLPDTAAQVARNCKLYSGNVLPYPQSVAVGSIEEGFSARTLYALRNPETHELEWVAWPTDVSIAVATPSEDADQRFYYTGDGKPKVSNYELWPDYYDLGLPIPPDEDQLVGTSTPIETKKIATYQRDNSNIARIRTTEPHNLRTGNSVTISGFSGIRGQYFVVGPLITVTLDDWPEGSTPSEPFIPFVPPGEVIQASETGDPDYFKHGLVPGVTVILEFPEGNVPSGAYVVETVSSDRRFTVRSPTIINYSTGAVRLSVSQFNGTNVEVTVIDPATIEYFNPGPPVEELYAENAQLVMSGNTEARTYVYTWITPWDEESIASRPSEPIFIKTGQQVTITELPTERPSGKNYIRGVRLYRSVSNLSGTEYFKLRTLWFPSPIEAAKRTNDICQVRCVLGFPHNLSIGDVFQIANATMAGFNVVNAKVTDVFDQYTFEYFHEGPTVDWTDTFGIIYHDVSEDPGRTPARYWGLNNDYSFLDDFDSRKLTVPLETDEYEAPPPGLQGITQIGDNILVGFVGNTLYFSEPNRPHAWPREYSRVVEHQIVGIAAIAGSMLVTTDAYPYIVAVSDPAIGASVSRVDVLYPCLNRRSMVTMPYGIVYATHDGLAVYSPFAGAQLITQQLHHSDTWNERLNPHTLVASVYNNAYLASHADGGIVYERVDEGIGMFVDLDVVFAATWYDTRTNKLYFTRNDDPTVYLWDDKTQPDKTYEWRSKVIITPDMMNFGAARVIADYQNSSQRWGEANIAWGEADRRWGEDSRLKFSMWADKQLLFTVQLGDDGIFRLPTGYRTDTFEVAVEGNIRLRAIHLAQTPTGLKAV